MSSTSPREETKSVAPALSRGFAILDLIARKPGLSFAEIRNQLDLPNSSCHHLISTLCQVGALQLQANRGYVLGLRLFELGSIAANQRQLDEYALPALTRLAEELRLTCHLGVMEGDEAVYLFKVEGNRNIRINTWVGKRLSLHSSALGKILQAWLPQEELDAKLARLGWERKTEKTFLNPDEFKRHLLEVRERGWAFDDEEDITTLRCIAAPIRNAQGTVIAAISAAGTILDIREDNLPALAAKVRQAAKEISHNLGYSP